ncbi:hypothetical protein [Streptomyces asoensis]|uniref:Acetyltransferase n=1 Tax=Streptomyces asoensis TaxID=249586 RepID=A0ABQ3S1D8_9ACTN|nr:hypothetical protein [Streptomyces asoensis]GGQ62875.1 hypothetical protein GCM10010496_27870 [Streptomyces asoensis]GHI61802.1 hypothetical protein Saso_34520 [Streptomyces asoensis]
MLLARGEGRLVGVVITLDRHPDPADPGAFAFWTALGHRVVGHRPDLERGRPCAVPRKPLR